MFTHRSKVSRQSTENLPAQMQPKPRLLTTCHHPLPAGSNETHCRLLLNLSIGSLKMNLYLEAVLEQEPVWAAEPVAVEVRLRISPPTCSRPTYRSRTKPPENVRFAARSMSIRKPPPGEVYCGTVSPASPVTTAR